MSIQAMKQTNRQTKTVHSLHIQLNRWQKKIEGFDAFNLTLCVFIGYIYSFCLFLYIFVLFSIQFFSSFLFFWNHIPLCIVSHRSHLFEYFILNSQFLFFSLFLVRSLTLNLICLIFTKTWSRFIGSCLAIKLPINDKKSKQEKI